MKSNLKFAFLAIAFMITLSFRPLPKQNQQPQQQKYYYIRFTPEVLNQILATESKLPYEQSAGTIADIQRQAYEQDNPIKQPRTDSTSTKPKKQ